MLSQFSLPSSASSVHSLLEPPSPAYTIATVRRAFIVWLRCGQQNEFRHVCNYFHHLEAMEEKLPAEVRATSRLHEFNLLTKLPPSSNFLTTLYPTLYRSHTQTTKINVRELQEIALEDCVFNLEGFHDLKIQKGATTKDIIKTSQMIRSYCISHSKSLRLLLSDFQNFSKMTISTNSVDNIAMYIKKQYLKDELVTWSNIKNYSFLDELEDTDTESELVDIKSTNKEVFSDDKSPIITTEDHTFNANKTANEIKILINGPRRKEILNMIQNAITAKLSNMPKSKPEGDL